MKRRRQPGAGPDLADLPGHRLEEDAQRAAERFICSMMPAGFWAQKIAMACALPPNASAPWRPGALESTINLEHACYP